MFASIKRQKGRFLFSAVSRLLVFVLSFSLVLGPSAAQAQTIASLNLPVPGAMVGPSAAFVPVLLKGMTIHPDNPLQFDFIIDSGNTNFTQDQIKDESRRLVKYFLASMTIPKDDLWVNLSPYESDRIIPKELGKTELGRDMLAQDYILKQLTASLMYPEKELGKEFWNRVYVKVKERFGTTEIPVDTFNKVWILPETAVVYEHGQTVYIVEAKLRVMLDSDYLAMNSNVGNRHAYSLQDDNQNTTVSTDIIREIILPEIEREVNEGQNFAPLRQIYHSLILAKWYKETIKNSLLSKIYVDQKKIAGVNLDDTTLKDQIYAQYMEAYKKGVFNYIKEDYDRLGQEMIPRKYFSGGIDKLTNIPLTHSSSPIKESINPKYRMEVGVSPEGDKKNILAKLARMSKTATTLALIAALTCAGGGCAPEEKERLKSQDEMLFDQFAQLPLDELIDILFNDTEPNRRKTAAIAIGRKGEEKSIDALAQALYTEKVHDVLDGIVQGLGASKNIRAVDILINLIETKTLPSAAYALKQLEILFIDFPNKVRQAFPLLIEYVREGWTDAIWIIDQDDVTTDVISAMLESIRNDEPGAMSFKREFFHKHNWSQFQKYMNFAREDEKNIMKVIFKTLQPYLEKPYLEIEVPEAVEHNRQVVINLFKNPETIEALKLLNNMAPEVVLQYLPFLNGSGWLLFTFASQYVDSIIEDYRKHELAQHSTVTKLFVQSGYYFVPVETHGNRINSVVFSMGYLTWTQDDVPALQDLLNSPYPFYRSAAQNALDQLARGQNKITEYLLRGENAIRPFLPSQSSSPISTDDFLNVPAGIIGALHENGQILSVKAGDVFDISVLDFGEQIIKIAENHPFLSIAITLIVGTALTLKTLHYSWSRNTVEGNIYRISRNNMKDLAIHSDIVKKLVELGKKDGGIDRLIRAIRPVDSNVRLIVVEALNELGVPPAKIVKEYVDELSHYYEHTRLAAVLALSGMGYKEAIEPLLDSLSDQSSAVRSAAEKALTDLGATKEQMIKGYTRAMSSFYGDVAAQKLNNLGATRDQMIEGHIRQLSSYHDHIRGKAVEELNKFGANKEQMVNGYIEALLSEHREVSKEALRELTNLENVAVESLIKRLSDKDSDIRKKVVEALGKIGDRIAVEPLIKQLTDENSAVVRAAAEALGTMGDQRGIEPIYNLITKNKKVFRSSTKAYLKLTSNVDSDIKEIYHELSSFPGLSDEAVENTFVEALKFRREGYKYIVDYTEAKTETYRQHVRGYNWNQHYDYDDYVDHVITIPANIKIRRGGKIHQSNFSASSETGPSDTPRSSSPIESGKNKEFSALAVASAAGDRGMVERLLKEGADVNYKNYNDVTALMIAVEKEHMDVMEVLVSNRADVNAEEKEGHTPLLVASFLGNTEIIDFLIKNGAKVNFKNKLGIEPVSAAAFSGNIHAVELLLHNQANINSQDNDGETPLMAAVKSESVDMVKFLVDRGAHVHLLDDQGRSALDFARTNRSRDIRVFLVNKIISKSFGRMELEDNRAIKFSSGKTDIFYSPKDKRVTIKNREDGPSATTEDNRSSSPMAEQGPGDRISLDFARDSLRSQGAELVASDEIRDTNDKVGGIDMNAIDLDRQGAGVDLQFDPAELQEIIDAGIDGFAPVIINITPLPSVLPLLGLEPQRKEEELEVSSLN